MTRKRFLGVCVVAVFALGGMLAVSAQAKKAEKGPFKYPFTGAGAVTLSDGTSALTLSCTNSQGTGEVTSGTMGTLTETWTGCELEGHKCMSTGASAGTLVTKSLLLETGWINKTPGE